MKDNRFPAEKNVIVKRTKSGQRYLLHDKDSCGKDIYVTIPIVDTDTTKEYFRKIKEARIKLSAKKNGVPFERFVEEYISKKNLSENTALIVRQTLSGFTLDNAENIKRVKRIVNDKSLKPGSKKTKVGYIHTVFKWLILSGRGEGIADPTLEFSIKHVISRRTRTMTKREEDFFLQEVKKIRYPDMRLMLQLAFFTGARISTIYEIKPNSIRDNKVYYYNVKSRKNYDYPVPLYDQDTIDLFHTLSMNGVIFKKSLHCYQNRCYLWMCKMFGRDENGETLTIHSLRHSFATRAIQKGISPEIVARLLDHSSPAITLKVYAKHSDEQLEDAILRITSRQNESKLN